MEIYRRLRPGDPPTLETAKTLFHNLFFNPERYDLSKVGRLKLNYKFYRDCPRSRSPALDAQVLTPQDILETVRHLIELKNGRGSVDDIDHLGNRRVRAVGELMENQYRIGLVRMERAIKERMSMSQEIDTLMPHDLINAKPVERGGQGVLRLARSSRSSWTRPTRSREVTHKRRLSALGPGGLTRERAGFEVRDVHATHYGRICPIETPEGPNIGLIASLVDLRARQRVRLRRDALPQGRATARVHRRGALVSARSKKRASTSRRPPRRLDEKGKLHGAPRVSARYNGDFQMVTAGSGPADGRGAEPDGVGRRGARSVPRARRREPRAHGREHAAPGGAADSHAMRRSSAPAWKAASRATPACASSPSARASSRASTRRASWCAPTGEGGEVPDIYPLDQVPALQPVTCYNQKPIVRAGDKVKAGDVLADGPACDMGELALGQNVVVAFMPWQGYNFEDSILVSERIAKDDVFTSIHIEEFECVARDTKLGKEEITRDIPNVGEEALKDLDESGIVRIGAEVKPGDILVGKITPKGETPALPRREAAARDLRREGRRRARQLAQGPAGRRRHRHQRPHLLAQGHREGRARQGHRGQRARASSRRTRDEEIEDPPRLVLPHASSAILDRQDDRRQARRRQGQGPARTRAQSSTDAELDAIPRKYWGEIPVDEGRGEGRAASSAISKTWSRLAKSTSTTRSIACSQGRRAAAGRDQDGEGLHRHQAQAPGRRQDGRSPRQQGRRQPHPSGRRHAVPAGRPPGRPRAEPARRAEPHERRSDPRDAPRLGRARARPADRRTCSKRSSRRRRAPRAAAQDLRTATDELDEVHRRALPDDGAPKLARQVKMRRASSGVRRCSTAPTRATSRTRSSSAGSLDRGQAILFDGRTGEPFEQDVTVGVMYMLKLHHLVDDKIHARSIGPYSLVTQQPLGGKAQFGGQRLGEMEVWAMEAYGAAYALQEFLTVKSDDVKGRTRMYEAIVKGDYTLEAGPAGELQRAHQGASVAVPERRAHRDAPSADAAARSSDDVHCSGTEE